MVGLGRAGFAAARALARAAGTAAVRVWDGAADTAQLNRAAVLRREGISVQLGGDGLDLLDGTRTIVKSPGVPPRIPLVAEALRRDLVVVGELEIGWQLVPVPTVGVTGTKGKSTTAKLCLNLLRTHGLETAQTGNTEYGPPLCEIAVGTHPQAAVAEVSSYQAEFARDLALDAAVFTNLTVEHLNHHADMEAYGDAKRRIFVRGDWCVPLASLNLDDELGRRLARKVDERGGRALTYGRGPEAEYRIRACRWTLREGEAIVEAPDGEVELRTPLPGPHNAANVTAVLALADGLGIPREVTLQALATVQPVPGRFEVVEVDRPFDVVVDLGYAPDSARQALRTARQLVEPRGGRLLTVLGVVGRSGPLIGREVGAIARELSDHLILSGVSYRGEPRLVTLAETAAGARPASGGSLEIVIDRREAIARALAAARPGDLVMVLGRGPVKREATDWRGGFVDLDDRVVVRELA